MKYRHDYPDWTATPRDYAHRPAPRRGILDPIGNVVGALLVLAGILILIVLLHRLPDASDFARLQESHTAAIDRAAEDAR